MGNDQIEELKQAVGVKPYERRLGRLRKSGRAFKARCPWHRDRNPSLSIYPKDGVFQFKCFGVDGTSGDVIDFVMKSDNLSFRKAFESLCREAGIKFEEQEMTEETEKPGIQYEKKTGTTRLLANKSALAYLETRGITPEAAERHELGLFDYPGFGLCIAIPYPSGDAKFRALEPRNKQDRFRSIGSLNSRLYGIDSLGQAASSTTQNVLIVESELDRITASEHLDPNQFVVVSVPSATASLAGGELKTEKEQIEKLKQGDRKIFVATDQDVAGEQWANAALKSLPVDRTSRVTWTGAKDIGELYEKFGDKFADEVSHLCNNSLIPVLWRRAVPFSILPEKKFEWIVPDLIPADGITLLTGNFGSFKSYMSLLLADAIAGGGTFLQRQCQQHPVLILDRENSHSTQYLRRNLVGDLKSRDNVRILADFTDPVAPDFTDPGLLSVCARIKPVLIADSLTDFHRGLKENDSDDMTQCFCQIRALVTAGARAVIVLHHVPKGGRGAGSSYRGSTSIPAAGSAALLIEKEGKDKAIIKGMKSRDGQLQTIRIKLSFGKQVTYKVLDDGLDPETELRASIETYVQQNPGSTSEGVAAKIRKRHQTVADVVNSMIKNGRLRRAGPKRGGKGSGLYVNTLLPIQAVPQEGLIN